MNRVLDLARIAARRIRGGTDPVEAIAEAINGAVSERVAPEAGYGERQMGGDADLRTVQWAVYLGCSTARRLAEEWSIPLKRARELLEQAKGRGLLGGSKGNGRGYHAPKPGEPGTTTIQVPRVVAVRRSA